MKTPILICLFLLAIPMGNARANATEKMQHATAYVDLFDFESKIRELFKAEFAKQNVSMDQADVLINKFNAEFRKILIDSMAQVFTSEELAALVVFYSSPTGRSIAKKQVDMDKYINDALEKLLVLLNKKY